MNTVYFSQSLEKLFDCFLHQMRQEAPHPLRITTVLVPNESLKQWLLLKIAKVNGIAMGLKFQTAAEWIGSRFPSPIEMHCLIYQFLSESGNEEIVSYTQGNPKRLIDLSKELAPLFFRYGQYGEKIFETLPKKNGWQWELIRNLFVVGPRRLPVQGISHSENGRLHCFGVDDMPPVFLDVLCSSASLTLYLFSPCVYFWEDLATDRERRNQVRRWKMKNAGAADRLDQFLRDAPPLLANWGRIGREFLKKLDPYPFQAQENYLEEEEATLLQKIRADLLYFRTEKEEKSSDSTIQIHLTGSSRLREIERVRDQILLFASELNISFHEMSILAPDLEPYVPLIEWVFSDPASPIPYRIHGVDLGLQSSFYQGLQRLVKLALGRWDVSDVLALFETPAFYRKCKWDRRFLEQIREWIERARIDWGIDAQQRSAALSESFGKEPSTPERGSWDAGIDWLLDRMATVLPGRENIDIDPSALEEFCTVFCSLKEDLAFLGGAFQTLEVWAGRLQQIAEKYLIWDGEDAAANSSFKRFLNELRQASLPLNKFPFSLIREFLSRPASGQIHGSHLHAVQAASIEEGALIPRRVLFLIGMDEESFPRKNRTSSLDLLKQEKIPVPESSDKDRYLFLQALFSAKEFLQISFGHLSPDEGKPVGPSLVVQELASHLNLPFVPLEAPKYPQQKKSGSWPDLSRLPELELPQGELTIPIADLAALARHPWKFYLQKVQGMFLNEPIEETFSLQKSLLAREVFERKGEVEESLPPGLFGEALRLEIGERVEEWKKTLKSWDLQGPFTLSFQTNCVSEYWESPDRRVMPPLEICWGEQLKVRLTGEIRNASSHGLIHWGEDQIGGALKIWPEALIAAIALHAPQILFLKTGKIKNLENPERSLKEFLEYYLRCLKTPSPLLADWADLFLRGGRKKESPFDDPFVDWVLSRNDLPEEEKIEKGWGGYLKGAFSGLASLYPSRSSSKETHAAV